MAGRAGRDGQFLLRNGLWLIVFAFLNDRCLLKRGSSAIFGITLLSKVPGHAGKFRLKSRLKRRILAHKGEVIASRIEVGFVAIDRQRAGPGHAAGRHAGQMADAKKF